jgi:hypothetical protein
MFHGPVRELLDSWSDAPGAAGLLVHRTNGPMVRRSVGPRSEKVGSRYVRHGTVEHAACI